MTACCAGPFGAVRLLLRPSWLTAAPDSRARGETDLDPVAEPAPKDGPGNSHQGRSIRAPQPSALK